MLRRLGHCNQAFVSPVYSFDKEGELITFVLFIQHFYFEDIFTSCNTRLQALPKKRIKRKYFLCATDTKLQSASSEHSCNQANRDVIFLAEAIHFGTTEEVI